MSHRGPDGAASEFRLNGRVALGHRRLAIVDLTEKGMQPMTNEEGTIWLVCNGEIYNFRELRRELEDLGHFFRSSSDSEVLVHGYEAWGTSILDRIEGMFALAIWDEPNQKLFLARDRIGIKPLYYLEENDRFIFASELKGIVSNPSVQRRINWDAVADFFVHRFIPNPSTIWRSIKKLPPGHYLEYRLHTGQSSCQRYWDLNPADLQISQADAAQKCRELLISSVRKHLISDAPLGVLLSSGYDSSALVMMMAELNETIRSFTLGFSNDENSEHLLAREVARSFGSAHKERIIQNELKGLAPRISHYFDEPLGGSSLLPTYLISELASQSVKTVLGGDGGDEVFAGYTWHMDIYDSLYSRNVRKRLKARVDFGWKVDLARAYHTLNSWTQLSYRDLPDFLDPALISSSADQDDAWIYRKHLPSHPITPIKAFQILDYRTLLCDVFLAKVDRASMAHSLEVRLPFLDHHLVEFTALLAENVYFRRNSTKFLLGQFIGDRLPSPILGQPKRGFSIPRTNHLTLSEMCGLLSHGCLIRDGILQPKALLRMQENRQFDKLWAFYLFECWFSSWAGSE